MDFAAISTQHRPKLERRIDLLDVPADVEVDALGQKLARWVKVAGRCDPRLASAAV